jgi:acyl-coenzyme A thioesterase PaaI-like protein
MTNDQDIPFHSTCFACGAVNENGLHLIFKDGPGGTTCEVSIPDHFQSYDGMVHGGIIATLLDAAMIHCLQSNYGTSPKTCRLEVRYLHVIHPGEHVTVNARMAGKRGRLLLADAEVLCSGVCSARARGAFTSR